MNLQVVRKTAYLLAGLMLAPGLIAATKNSRVRHRVPYGGVLQMGLQR